MNLFDQHTAACRCEWGVVGYDALARADVVIIVDVLSFSTCVDIAVGRGAAILPYSSKDGAARAFAHAHCAVLAGARGEARYSLSPASFIAAPRGLRCVLPSPNGATLAVRAAEDGATVLAGCFRNAAAVARAAREFGDTFNVCPAGERWHDGSLRFAVEDWLAAGAILGALPGGKSVEASAAIAAYESAQETIEKVLLASGSGRELIARGFESDVALAAQVDVSKHVARLEEGAFVGLHGVAVEHVFPADMSRSLHRAFLHRQATDYGAEATLTHGEIESLITEARVFVSQVRTPRGERIWQSPAGPPVGA